MVATNTSTRFAKDVGYTKRPKKPKLPLAGEPKRKSAPPPSLRERKKKR